jgi:hypothetical protein
MTKLAFAIVFFIDGVLPPDGDDFSAMLQNLTLLT